MEIAEQHIFPAVDPGSSGRSGDATCTGCLPLRVIRSTLEAGVTGVNFCAERSTREVRARRMVLPLAILLQFGSSQL